MNDLAGPLGELHFTVTVTRKATGKVETYEMVGHPLPTDEVQPKVKENDNGCYPFDRCA